MCLPIFLIIRMKLKKLLKLSVEKKQHNEAEENVDKYGDMLCVGNANAINGNIEDAEEDEHDCEVEVGEEENVEADIVDNYAHEVGEEVKVERGEECGVYAVIYEGEDDEDGDGEGLEEEDRMGDERESGVCVVIDDSNDDGGECHAAVAEVTDLGVEEDEESVEAVRRDVYVVARDDDDGDEDGDDEDDCDDNDNDKSDSGVNGCIENNDIIGVNTNHNNRNSDKNSSNDNICNRNNNYYNNTFDYNSSDPRNRNHPHNFIYSNDYMNENLRDRYMNVVNEGPSMNDVDEFIRKAGILLLFILFIYYIYSLANLILQIMNDQSYGIDDSMRMDVSRKLDFYLNY
ncbi:hypothetical protein MN116_008980 [Schistosoma mekongi]|uniref:Uncharacterized protein n=2 Tax=Schistosoma mekongi TaxID=38744 RepID=A0AAE1Z514_SCHME|nr:hypothetical protein MN116_008980 [Schistosoma mekongi]